ncbi:MAG TPA: hypothetical protein VF160_09745 [Candidatus Dormibacteraeota bacterium]
MREPAEQHVPVADPALRAQLLATEHWSLLATRSMTMNEMLSRISTFLLVVSSSLVSLALVAQFTHFDARFLTFALVLLGALVVIGTMTGRRVGNASLEDLALVIGMNRVRAGYLELDPGLERYLVTSAHDDARGVWQSYNHLLGPRMVSNILASSGTFITFVTAGLMAAFVAMCAVALAAPVWVVWVCAAAGGVLYAGLSLLSGRRSYRRVKRSVLFPEPPPAE